MSTSEYLSNFAWYSDGMSTSSYSPVFVPLLYMWHFFENRLMIPWKSDPSPIGISMGITFGVI